MPFFSPFSIFFRATRRGPSTMTCPENPAGSARPRNHLPETRPKNSEPATKKGPISGDLSSFLGNGGHVNKDLIHDLLDVFNIYPVHLGAGLGVRIRHCVAVMIRARFTTRKCGFHPLDNVVRGEVLEPGAGLVPVRISSK